MNFDDLHDPQPPRPGPAALAAVAGRARQLRRRRTAMVATATVAALAAILVPTALVVTGSDGDGGRIVPATSPESTVAPPSTASAPTSPPTLATTPQTTPSTGAPSVGVVASAILGNGDAVVVEADLSTRLVHDGADPNDPPAEGELTTVDSVLVTPTGRVFVSTCCEPVPGAWFEVGASGAVISDVRFGHALALSPDGTRLASVGGSGITVTDLDGAILATADLSGSPVYRQPESVMWLDDDTLAVVELRQLDTGNEFRLSTVDATLTGAATAEDTMIGTDLEATWPRLGGVADDGSILVFRGARGGTVSGHLEAYDPVSLVARPASDILLPGVPGVDAWYDGRLIWVGSDDVLHLDGVEVPGEFAWARPA